MLFSFSRPILMLVTLIGFVLPVQSQTTLKVQITDLSDVDCQIAYYYGDKQYISDTFHLDSKGMGVIKSEESKSPGIYMLVYPSGSYTEFLYDKGDLSFSVASKNPAETIKFKASVSNKLWVERNLFLKKVWDRGDALKKAKTDENAAETENKLAKIDTEIENYDQNIVAKYPKEMITEILKVLKDPVIPEKLTDERERFYYYKSHFFDNVDFSSKWIIRSPIYHGKLIRYMDELTLPYHDSINSSCDELIARTKGNDELYKYTVITLVNKYSKSKMMTDINCYLHLIEKYYLSGLATWADAENIERMRKSYNSSINNIVGATGKEMLLKDLDNKNVSSARKNRDKKYKFTILFFWSHDSNQCIIMADELESFFQSKEEDVEIIGIQTQEIENYRSFVEQKNYHWIHTKPTNENYREDYNVYSTPLLFVLDENDEIIGRHIGVSQLQLIIDRSRE